MIGREGRVDDGADLRRRGCPGGEKLFFLRGELRIRAIRPAEQIVGGAAKDVAQPADGLDIKPTRFLLVSSD